MHEIRATVPVERSAAIARLALDQGIQNVSIYEIFVHGAETCKHVVSVEVSTPKADDFIDAVLASPHFDRKDCSLSSRQLRAVVNSQSLADLTYPMVEPAPDVIEDLWQLSFVTPSYAGRAAGGAILMAAGVVHNSPVEIVVAALILPFLAQVLGVGFGVWAGDWGLARRGALAVLTSAVLAYCMGLLVASLTGGPVRFHEFQSPLASFAISGVIGAAAGLSEADDVGRRYMIGVAAAVQFSIFPSWFGTATILGVPGRDIVLTRVASFAINLVTMPVAAMIAYAVVGSRRSRFQRVAHRSRFTRSGTGQIGGRSRPERP